MALNVSHLQAHVQEYYLPGFANNIYDKSALLSTLKRDGRLTVRGGERITEGITYAKKTAKGTYSGHSTIDVAPNDTKTRAKFEWGHYYVAPSVARTDILKASGPFAVASIIESEMENSEMAMNDQVADAIFSGTSPDGIVGLDSAIGTTNTYGDIDGNANSWWRSTVDTTGHTKANMKTAASTSYVLTLLANAFAGATHFGSSPNLVITTWDVFGILEAVLQANASYEQLNARSNSIAQSGFQVIQFRGVPIVPDEKCPAYHMYVLNTNFMKLYVHPDDDFEFSGFVKPVNQMVQIGTISWTCQLGIKSRRNFYKFTSLGAS